MQKLNLDEDSLSLVKAIIKKWVPDAEIWAYGSRVHGNCHEGSDLDLVIRYPKNLEKPTYHLATLKEAFKESDLPILVDIMDWAALPASYRDEIEKKYVVIQ